MKNNIVKSFLIISFLIIYSIFFSIEIFSTESCNSSAGINLTYKINTSNSLIIYSNNNGSVYFNGINLTYEINNTSNNLITYSNNNGSVYFNGINLTYEINTSNNLIIYSNNNGSVYFNGINLTYEIFLNYTNSQNSTNQSINISGYPSYVSPPTPINNQKIIDIKNITIKVFGEGNDLKSCRVVINNSINNISKTYVMNNNGTYCTYVYQINETNNIQRIDFQVYYNISSTEYSMDRRTLYVYPSSENSTKVLPAYGLGSLIITLVVIIGGFLI